MKQGVLRNLTKIAFRVGVTAALASVAALPSLPATGETIIRMPAGGYRTIEPTRPFDQVVNRTPEVITVEEDKANQSFRIRALSPGEGVVELHSTDGRGKPSVRSFRVLAKESNDRDGGAGSPVQEQLGSSNGSSDNSEVAQWIAVASRKIKARPMGDKLVLTGELSSLAEFRRLERMVTHNVASFVPQYEIATPLLDEIINDINRRLRGNAGVSLTLVRSGSSIIATTDDPTSKRNERLISRYSQLLPSFDADRSGNPYPDSQIKVTMHFVESTENNSTERGQKFSGVHVPLTGQITASGIEQAPFEFYLKYLSAHMSTRLLEQPAVMAQSGTTAELHSGGDLAYQASASVHGVATQFRSYGLTAKVSPKTRFDGDIKLDLDLDISDPSGAETQAMNQTINSRKVKSSLVLQDGMSRLVARLRRQKREKSSAAPPLFADIPVISWIVSNKGSNNKVQDLWIFVSATSDLYQPFGDSEEVLNRLTQER